MNPLAASVSERQVVIFKNHLKITFCFVLIDNSVRKDQGWQRHETTRDGGVAETGSSSRLGSSVNEVFVIFCVNQFSF